MIHIVIIREGSTLPTMKPSSLGVKPPASSETVFASLGTVEMGLEAKPGEMVPSGWAHR